MRGKGIASGETTIAWSDLIKFKRTFTEPVSAMREKNFVKNGIHAYHGIARFRGPNSVEVNGEVLEGRFILIAVGAVPMHLDIPGEQYLTTSTEFLEIDQSPKQIILVGGDFIAAELSHIAARAGAQVTVLQRADHMLTASEPDLIGWLMEKFHAVGIDIRLETSVTSIERKTAMIRNFVCLALASLMRVGCKKKPAAAADQEEFDRSLRAGRRRGRLDPGTRSRIAPRHRRHAGLPDPTVGGDCRKLRT